MIPGLYCDPKAYRQLIVLEVAAVPTLGNADSKTDLSCPADIAESFVKIDRHILIKNKQTKSSWTSGICGDEK